ncbi:MAG: TetR/AcrR family transcriptional regulator [Anaerolineales bacterium]
MSPKHDVSEERKSQILDAAMNTFSELGFHKARMSDIAETSGLSKGSLYWYFDSKDSIILSLLDRVFVPEIRDFNVLLKDPRSAESRLASYIKRVSDDMVKLLKWMPLFYDFLALAFRQELVKKAISRYYKKQMEILVELIQQGLDSGEFLVEDPEEAAIALGSILEGTIVLWLFDPEQIDVRRNLRTSSNLLIQALKTKPTPPHQLLDN